MNRTRTSRLRGVPDSAESQELKGAQLSGRVDTSGIVAEKATLLRGGVRVDPEPEPVHHDVVVEPAKGCEVVGIVIAVVGPHSDVMNLETVARVATGDGAASVSPLDEAAHLGRYRPGAIGCDDGLPVLQPNQLDAACAENLVEHHGAHPGSKFDLTAKLSPRLRLVGIEEDRDHGLRTTALVTGQTERLPGVLADRDQCVGPTLAFIWTGPGRSPN